jgi:hypothetical protein
MQENYSFFHQRGPWRIDADIMNTGSRKCFVKWESDAGNPVTIEPGGILELENFSSYINTKPRLTSQTLLFGPEGPTNKATVMLYARGAP